MYAKFVNAIRPLEHKLSSCVDNLKSLSREVEELENNLENWRNKYNDLRDDNERLKDEHKTTKNDLTRERINSAQTKTSLDNANSNNSQLTRQLQDKESQLVQKNNEIRRIEGEKTNLRLEHGKEITKKDIEIKGKDSQLNEKKEELKRKEKEIELLQNQRNLTQEELLVEKIRFERRNLELFANELRINLEQIQSLIRHHEKLLQDRKNVNHVDVITHQDNIVRAKQALLDQGIGMVSVQEICEKCERIAELNWELQQIQQPQYQAQQEIPTNQ